MNRFIHSVVQFQRRQTKCITSFSLPSISTPNEGRPDSREMPSPPSYSLDYTPVPFSGKTRRHYAALINLRKTLPGITKLKPLGPTGVQRNIIPFLEQKSGNTSLSIKPWK